MFHDDHHADGRLAIWCAAAMGVQDMLVKAGPEDYFVPPYVGHLGWLGVRLDRKLAWEEIEGMIREAHLTRSFKGTALRTRARRP